VSTSQRAAFLYSCLTRIIWREVARNCIMWRFVKRVVAAVVDGHVECMGSLRNAYRILIRKRKKTGNLGDLHIARKVISRWL